MLINDHLPLHLRKSIRCLLSSRTSVHNDRTEDPPYDYPRERLRIGIIGAGVSGIAAAAHIAELGHDCCIFESGGEESLGGVWTRTNQTSSLQISSHFYHPHPSIRWSCEYPGQQEIVQQVRELWLRFGLQHQTVFNCPVTSLTKSGSKWSINGGTEGYFDAIVAAIGTCGAARPYRLPGQEHFRGDLVHSTQLNGLDVKGKTVVIVGGGASAVEALEYAHDHGARTVKIISRSEKWIIPRWRLLNMILAASLSGPLTLWSYMVGELLRLLFYRKDCSHVAPSRRSDEHLYSSTPIVNSRALDIIRSGKADWIKGHCSRFEQNGIVLERLPLNDRCPPKSATVTEPCDVCIQATGFDRPTLHFLERPCGKYQPPDWWLQVFPPGEPTLCALNSTWQEAFGSVGGGQIALLTRLLLTFAIEPATQPSCQTMENWVDFMLRWNGGMRFITHIEMYLLPALAIACNYSLWPWANFILLGGDMPQRRSRSHRES